MNRQPSKTQYRLGDLVIAAFEQAERLTRSRRLASRLAVRTLTDWVAKSNRPELLNQLQTR